MKVFVWLAMIVVALIVLIPPASAKRDDGRGCSKKDWRYVLEGSDPAFRLCLLKRTDDR